jgi:hypothetical protein
VPRHVDETQPRQRVHALRPVEQPQGHQPVLEPRERRFFVVERSLGHEPDADTAGPVAHEHRALPGHGIVVDDPRVLPQHIAAVRGHREQQHAGLLDRRCSAGQRGAPQDIALEVEHGIVDHLHLIVLIPRQ